MTIERKRLGEIARRLVDPPTCQLIFPLHEVFLATAALTPTRADNEKFRRNPLWEARKNIQEGYPGASVPVLDSLLENTRIEQHRLLETGLDPYFDQQAFKIATLLMFLNAGFSLKKLSILDKPLELRTRPTRTISAKQLPPPLTLEDQTRIKNTLIYALGAVSSIPLLPPHPDVLPDEADENQNEPLVEIPYLLWHDQQLSRQETAQTGVIPPEGLESAVTRIEEKESLLFDQTTFAVVELLLPRVVHELIGLTGRNIIGQLGERSCIDRRIDSLWQNDPLTTLLNHYLEGAEIYRHRLRVYKSRVGRSSAAPSFQKSLFDEILASSGGSNDSPSPDTTAVLLCPGNIITEHAWGMILSDNPPSPDERTVPPDLQIRIVTKIGKRAMSLLKKLSEKQETTGNKEDLLNFAFLIAALRVYKSTGSRFQEEAEQQPECLSQIVEDTLLQTLKKAVGAFWKGPPLGETDPEKWLTDKYRSVDSRYLEGFEVGVRYLSRKSQRAIVDTVREKYQEEFDTGAFPSSLGRFTLGLLQDVAEDALKNSAEEISTDIQSLITDIVYQGLMRFFNSQGAPAIVSERSILAQSKLEAKTGTAGNHGDVEQITQNSAGHFTYRDPDVLEKYAAYLRSTLSAFRSNPLFDGAVSQLLNRLENYVDRQKAVTTDTGTVNALRLVAPDLNHLLRSLDPVITQPSHRNIYDRLLAETLVCAGDVEAVEADSQQTGNAVLGMIKSMFETEQSQSKEPKGIAAGDTHSHPSKTNTKVRKVINKSVSKRMVKQPTSQDQK